jgi:hypothetical protein
MENVLRFIVRHLVFIVMAFLALYLVGLTFGAEANYFSWSIDAKFWFGFFANSIAVAIHSYWYENR